MKKHVRVVTAAIIREGKLLLCRRSDDSDYNGYFEFPGGKVEVGESDIIALKRELTEELSIDADITKKIDESYFEYPNFTINLALYEVNHYSGELSLNVHSESKWIEFSELDDYQFPAANKNLVAKLKDMYGR